MARDDIQLLYEYDRWANNRALHAVSALSPEQFTRDLGGSFRSVRNTLLHIIGGEWGWLTYWKASSHSAAFLAELWDRHDALFRPDAFPSLAAVRLKWEEIEKEQTEFVSSVTEEALNKMLPIRSTQLSLALDATSGQPLHVSSRSGRVDDAAAARRAITDRLPRVFGGGLMC